MCKDFNTWNAMLILNKWINRMIVFVQVSWVMSKWGVKDFSFWVNVQINTIEEARLSTPLAPCIYNLLVITGSYSTPMAMTRSFCVGQILGMAFCNTRYGVQIWIWFVKVIPIFPNCTIRLWSPDTPYLVGLLGKCVHYMPLYLRLNSVPYFDLALSS